MKRTIKLIIYYFLYQLLFTVLVMFGALLVEAARSGGDLDVLMSSLKSGALINNSFSTALATLLAALAMLWHLLHFRYIRFSTDFLKKENIPLLLVCIPFVYTLMYLLSWATEWINLPNLLEETFMDMSHSVVGILSIAFAAPILEECLFRGAIEGHLLSLWKGKPWAAILVSGLAFGLVHINPAQVLYASLIGLVLGWMRWRSGSIVPGIVAHILNNSISVVCMRLYGPEGSFEEGAGETAQPYIVAVYAVILILCAVFFYTKTKKTVSVCNLSEDSNV